ncbi:uncharacterized protein TNCV_1229901 [Trichonephila clavipes]|nr:uncharacterized protein TNCV_1229901 [Trichonephila clavipes]
MYPDVISFDKLNLSQFDWLEIEELEMQLIDFPSSSIWIQKFIETRKKLELIEAERLTSNISKNTSSHWAAPPFIDFNGPETELFDEYDVEPHRGSKVPSEYDFREKEYDTPEEHPDKTPDEPPFEVPDNE